MLPEGDTGNNPTSKFVEPVLAGFMTKTLATIKLLVVWTTVLCIAVQSFGRGPAAVLCFGGSYGSMSAGCCEVTSPIEIVVEDSGCCPSESNVTGSDTDPDGCFDVIVDADQRLGDAPQSCDFKPCFVGLLPELSEGTAVVMVPGQLWNAGNRSSILSGRGFAARSLVRLI